MRLTSAALLMIGTALLGLSAHAQSPEQSSAHRRPKSTVEVVFVVDTTGSMARLIEGAKRKTWSIATAIVDQNPEAEIRMGLVAYRDIGDDYVTKSFDLTTDIQSLYGHLLAFKADGGGDTPESVNEALDQAITRIRWDQGTQVRRMIFLVGDAPPHMDYRQDRKYPAILSEARERDIIVNAVQAGSSSETARVWREIAAKGKGEFIHIPSDGGRVVVIETPYDKEILELQIRINRTVLPYGKSARQEAVRRKVDSYREAPAPSSADMSGYVSKRSKGKDVVTGEGDLVSDVEAGRKELSSVPEDELPVELKAMKPEERGALLRQHSERRAAVSQQLAELVKMRDDYIRQEEAKAKPDADSFDRAVAETLRQQLRHD